MKKQYLFSFILLFFSLFAQAQESEENGGPAKRAEWQRKIIQDPKTGLVPLQELENGRNQVEQYYKNAKKSKTTAAIPNINWKERGPNNIAGRTRAIMWDPKNGDFTPKKKKVWAGGVSGGLWYNNDITDANSSWIKVASGQLWDNIAISWIASDPSDVNKNTMYASTGERGQQNAVSNTGSSGTGGGGIWKSIDGGTTWNRLVNTIPDYTIVLNGTSTAEDFVKVAWREIYKVIVLNNGDVLALTVGGILRSTNGGSSWTQLTGTGTVKVSEQPSTVSDMELGTDGILYVSEEGAADANGNVTREPRILKSTNNTLTDFVLCPLPTGSYPPGRVEIALAAGTSGTSTSQVIYAVSAAPSTPVYRFFLKSVNAGGTWTNMTPSVNSGAKPADKDTGGIAKGNNNAPATNEEPIFGSQGFWGLILGTHNTKSDALYFGGVSFDVSTNGGTSWNPQVKASEWGVMHNIMHADHHAFMANPDNNDEAIFGNDGGVYYSNNWSAPAATLAPLNIQARNKDYNVTQYFSVDLHPAAGNGLVVGGTQDNGTHAIQSAYNTIGAGTTINTGDGALTFIDQTDPNIVISSYIHISPTLHKDGGLSTALPIAPAFSNKGQFINPAVYDDLAHTYYANFTYDNRPAVTTPTTDTLFVRYRIETSTVEGDNGYKYTPSFVTYAVDATSQPPIKVSFMKLGITNTTTGQRVMYIGTMDGDVYKTSPFLVISNQTVTLTKIMDKATTGEGNVSCIDFAGTVNTIVVTKSNYNVKSVFYTTNANAGSAITWTSKDEATHGLPNIPIRYAIFNPNDYKQVLLATDLGVWSTTDITAANPDWKETNEALARVRCDAFKYRPSDKTLIVGTHGRGIFSVSLALPTCTPPTLATAGSNSPVVATTPLNLTSSATGGTAYAWAGPGGYNTTVQNPTVSSSTTAAMAGVYTVTIASAAGSTCTATATTMVTVNTCTIPTYIIAGSNSPVTAGTFAQVTASARLVGLTFAWTGPNGFTSAFQNPTVSLAATPTNSGVYSVTVSLSPGNTCSATATAMLTVNPAACTPPTLQSIGSNTPVTAGTVLNLTSSATGGIQYSWVGPNSFATTAQNPQVSVAATTAMAGVYTVTISSSAGPTCNITATTMVVINAAPTSCTIPADAIAGSNSPVTVGSPLQVTASAVLVGLSYAWTGPNGFTSVFQNPTVNSRATTAMAGVYTVRISSSSTCSATVTTMVVINAVLPTSSVVYVNIANTNTPQNGSSWATAYSNLQFALALAPANSDFWVAKGIYKPTASTNRIIPFIIPSGARLFGGFAGTETMLSQSNVEANPTILSGEIGSPTTVNDNSYHVVTFNRTNSDTRLDGFTVTGGNASFNSTRPPSLTASQPLSIFEGGGIGLDNGSSPTIINCKIISNDAIQGGGMFATNNSNPTVTNCVFMNNQATFGGGIYNLNSSPTYSNILIAGNKATGGGMYNNGSNPIITNVTIAGNGGLNGAIFNSNSAPVVKNSILWGNISPFNDTQSITSYSIVEGGYVGIGNLNVDPQFVNPVPNGLSPSLSGDYKLTNTSPAIDAGDNGMIGLTDVDLINNLRRFNGGIVDIGAYEFQGSRMGGTVTSIVSGNWEQGTTWSIGRKPGAGDTVIIDTNHIVTINSDGVVKNIEIRPNATLLYKTSGIKLQTGF